MNGKLVIPIAVVLLTGMLLGCSSKHAKLSYIDDNKREVRIYEVFGMDCPGCHGGLEKLVLKIPAVAVASADWKEQRLVVVVETGAQLNDELVYDAVRRANFTPGKRLQ